MKYMRLIIMLLISLCISNISMAIQQLTQEEIQALGLSEEETAQFQELMETLQNMPPEELKQLEELGQQLENDMRSQGLDPTNPDDIYKWVDTQGAQEPKPVTPPAQKEEQKLKGHIQPSIKKQEQFIQIVLPENAELVLNQINTALSKIRQKSHRNTQLYRKLESWNRELNLLQYYLHILTEPELLKHLTSKEFEDLYKKLESLYRSVKQYEPYINPPDIQPTDEHSDNPYYTLGIPMQASQQEITEAFTQLSEKYSPHNVKSYLNSKNITGALYKRRLKEASLIFAFIKDAYDILSDPKSRHVLDKSLQEEAKQEQITDQETWHAFNQLMADVIQLFQQSEILQEIEKLLAAHKPEELALAQSQEAIEKKVMQRAQQRQKKTPYRSTQQFYYPKPGEYDAFYRELKSSLQRAKHQPLPQYKPTSRPQQQPQANQAKEQTTTTKPSTGKKPAGKPDKKKAPGDTKANTAPPQQSGGIKSSKPASKTKKKEDTAAQEKTTRDAFLLVDKLADKLKSTQLDISIATATRSSEINQRKEKASKIPLAQLMQQVDRQMTTGTQQSSLAKRSAPQAEKPIDPIEQFTTYAEQNDFYSIANMLYKLNNLIPKIKPDAQADLKEAWQNSIVKSYSKLISNWYTHIVPVLDITQRQTSEPIRSRHYLAWNDPHPLKLSEPLYKKYREGKKEVRTLGTSQTTPRGAPLGWIARDIIDIHKYADQIHQQLNKKPATKKEQKK